MIALLARAIRRLHRCLRARALRGHVRTLHRAARAAATETDVLEALERLRHAFRNGAAS